jgi:SAM-dependent methyltransferase
VTEEASVSWSELSDWRAEAHARFGAIHDIPIVDFGAEMRRLTGGATRVLDVGAGRDQPLRKFIEADRTAYQTLDVDPRGEFDFARVSDVPAEARFDVVVANQILEHVSVADAIEIVTGIARILAPGGRFVATVPNTSHPVRQWDPTHLTPWPVFDFYGLFRMAGLDVERIARYGKRPLSRRPLRRLVAKAVAAQYRIDWCDSILAVGRARVTGAVSR